MKPEKEKTWEEVAASTAVDLFLKVLEMQRDKLKREIEEIYPELGKQAYRHRGTKETPWSVEQYLVEIANKDAEIARLSDLSNAIISEIRRMAVSA